MVYLDEFGHIGPFVSKNDPKFKESPVFGLAGYIIPLEEVRSFGTWFYQQKCRLLKFEIDRAEQHPAVWEKKGASLYTVTNVTKYQQLRATTNRILNKIQKVGGKTFYVGVRKTHTPETASSNALYHAILREAIKRLNDFCEYDAPDNSRFLMALDEHDQHDQLLTTASMQMYGGETPMRHLIEPPFQIQSHRYQTMQTADWLAGLVGRLGAIWAEPDQYPENEVFRTYFEARVNAASVRSGVRTK
ncbi:DUF3800 domain-containing protein [Epibacterium sp. Ofav1-8]|uniref:DUF3800 domain-containing protein n=1 Tax=Epibacterium sp. Ofav1-8 TaxID=2917735 RepID=UPI001EF74583|nr:DUF3800 domain-containing protein [Epibacterium sp. Ofav1-8]MCG7625947.1 DUF3800 domain-containing protein [Epibacterium sp. Ofav1-8]MCZ4270529.1 DUF3800 domain-containing protein [Rhodobacteraceae bacterium G21628-S1]